MFNLSITQGASLFVHSLLPHVNNTPIYIAKVCMQVYIEVYYSYMHNEINVSCYQIITITCTYTACERQLNETYEVTDSECDKDTADSMDKGR